MSVFQPSADQFSLLAAEAAHFKKAGTEFTTRKSLQEELEDYSQWLPPVQPELDRTGNRNRAAVEMIVKQTKEVIRPMMAVQKKVLSEIQVPNRQQFIDTLTEEFHRLDDDQQPEVFIDIVKALSDN